MIFRWAWSKTEMSFLVHETQKSAYLKNKFMNCDFLNADSDAIVFG